MANTAKASLFFQIILFSCAKSPVVKLSVPAGHHIILTCSGHTSKDTTHLEWKDNDNDVIAIKKGQSATTMRDHKYSLLSNGSLMIKSLDPGDSGVYRCRDQVVADVEVLTGEDYNITAGRTVMIPCKVSDKQRQRWMFKKSKPVERKPIYIRHRNGTLQKEIDDPENRFSHMEDNTLCISDVQPEDTGDYWCNGKRAAGLTVRTEKHDYTNQITTTDKDTEDDEPEDKDSGHENLVTAVAIGLGILVLLAGLLSLLLLVRKRSRKENKKGTTELQSKRPPDVVSSGESPADAQRGCQLEDSDIHYASLGRQNWKERLRTNGERHHVIYSTVAGGEG